MKIFVLVKVCTAIVLATGFATQVVAATLSGGYSLGGINAKCNISGQGSATLNESSPDCFDYFASGTFTMSGSGSASYDTLRATAGVEFTDYTRAKTLSATGKATYSDMLTIDITGRTGEIVDLFFTTEMNGNMSARSDTSMFGMATAVLQTRVNGYFPGIARRVDSDGGSLYNDFNPGLVQIQLGTPFSVSAILTVTARLDPVASVDGKFSGDVLSNFGSSAGITAFELFETGSDVLISDWNMTSESGEFGFYSAVPVPASVWLFGSGLIGLIGVARRKKA